MLDKNTLVKVANRGRGHIGYTVPDLNVRRQFMPFETKEISMEELRALSYIPGGRNLIKHYLIVENDEAVQELLGEVEPEYNYTEAEVRELLEHGTLDQLLDCLDFAPVGVIEVVKDLAVQIKLNDVQKRQAILDKTGFNVTKAIEIEEYSKEGSEDQGTPKQRRAEPITETESEKPERRTAVPKYKVVQ